MPAATLDALLARVWSGEQPLESIYAPNPAAPAAPPVLLAEGYITVVNLEEPVSGQPVTWPERRLVVRSVALATQQSRRLDERLAQAQAQISVLNVRKQGKKLLEAAGLTAAAEQILRPVRLEKKAA